MALAWRLSIEGWLEVRDSSTGEWGIRCVLGSRLARRARRRHRVLGSATDCGLLYRRLGRGTLAGALLFTLTGLSRADLAPTPIMAQPVRPVTWSVLTEDFEAGSLEQWRSVAPEGLELIPGAGPDGSTALAVAIGSGERLIFKSGVGYAREGYLTFWFHPHGVQLPEPTPNPWPPGSSLCLADIRSSARDWYPPLVGLYVRQQAGEQYVAFLAWPRSTGYSFDYVAGEFPVASGWQKITLGYRIGSWVAVWLNDRLVRYQDTDVVHQDPSGDVIQLGKVNRSQGTTPGGSILIDEVAFEVPRVDELWVDAARGSPANDGRSSRTPFATIQQAADIAGPGTVVHIQPGVYRETVRPALSGAAGEPVMYRSEGGPGKAILRGAEPSSALSWQRLAPGELAVPPAIQANLFVTDLTSWGLTKGPRFVVVLDADGAVRQRLPLAREPDWDVVSEWKYHEYWWAATGGSESTTCDPTLEGQHDCDRAQRSLTELTDDADDTEPRGIEPGNLTTLGDLTGATILVADAVQGHYTYRRQITRHDVAAGRLTVDRLCEHDSGTREPGLGWGSKYYLEDHPALLDSPGEWWYDRDRQRLYLWPPQPANPSTLNIEISRLENGFNLQNRSYVTLDGLGIELFNGSAIWQRNGESEHSYGNQVRHGRLRYANLGINLSQAVRADGSPAAITRDFGLEQSEIAHMDTMAMRLTDWWEDGAAAKSFRRSGVRDTVVRGNEMHHLGFRSDYDSGIGVFYQFAQGLRFEGNYIHHVAHNGVFLSGSVVQSDKTYGFAPEEIKTGEILVANNVFARACQAAADCGGLKIWGQAPDRHVFRDLLVTGNVFRDSLGWTYVAEKRGRWSGGPQSEVRGLGGFGLYVDHASGVHAYRNIAHNNSYTGYMVYGVWRDGDLVYFNNISANSLYGMILSGSQYDTHGSVNTQVVNNILINNEAFGLWVSYAEGRTANTLIDHNLYWANGWRSRDQGGFWRAGDFVLRQRRADGTETWEPFQTLAEVQVATPWERHGVAGDPAFVRYELTDRRLGDKAWPDFHLTPDSLAAIDGGTTSLPASLLRLLARFGVRDWHWGPAYDIGRYEGGFGLYASPAGQEVAPGGSALFSLWVEPFDLAHPVSLAVASPSAAWSTELSAAVVGPQMPVTLTVRNRGPAAPGVGHSAPITGTGGGFVRTTEVWVRLANWPLFLPMAFNAQLAGP